MRLKIVFFVLIAIFLAEGVAAGFNYAGNNLAASYNEGDKIRGVFNISFNSQLYDSVLTSNFEGNITLKDFLNLNNLQAGGGYNCTTINCLPDYSVGNAVNSLQLSSSDALAGFKINRPSVTITSASFKMQSNAPASCSNPISADVLNDGEQFFTTNQYSTEMCGSPNRGCFLSSASSEADIINTNNKKYCEKINLPAAAGFKIGAKVRNSTSGYAELKMHLYDAETTTKLGECVLPRHSQQLEELSCSVSYGSSGAKDYYVCITTQNNVGYKIGWETTSPTCGTAEGFGSFDSDFDIFGQALKFAPSPILEINDTSYQSQFNIKLKDLLDGYLLDKYSRDCQTNECIFPIKLFGVSQSLQISDVNIGYTSVGVPQAVNEIYELGIRNPEINSGMMSLDIEKTNFTIPDNANESKFKLYLNGELVFEKNINITRTFSFNVFPRFVLFGQNTLFTANTTQNITGSSWDFGDGTAVQIANGKTAEHRYTKQNSTSFNLRVTLTNSQGQTSTKTFQIFVGDPRELANLTILDYEKRIVNITSKINSYPDWVKQKLDGIINASSMSGRLNAIKSEYANSSTESHYQEVMLRLIALNVPYKLDKIVGGDSLPLLIGFEGINVNYIEQISNKDIQNNNDLRDSIIGLMNANFDAKLSYEQIAYFYDSGAEIALTKFKIETSPKKTIDDKNYLVFAQDVKKSGGFKENYNEKTISGSGIDYVELNTEQNQVFEFFIIGAMEASELGAYISPAVQDIDVIGTDFGVCELDGVCSGDETSESCPEDCAKEWFKFTLIGWIIILLVALVFYIILQEWYKRNYQRRLFPEENELYNLVNFIYNARRQGLSESTLKSKLNGVGWSGEKIRFALKKIDGKRAGMLEIPIFKFFENRKVKKEIAQRQASQI